MITAQQFNVTYVSSSVQFKSGSTEFGDSIDDTHIITGTIILNGSVLELSQLNNFSSSIRNEINGIEAYTSSLKSKLIVSSSTQIQNYDVFALNSNLYTATGSLIGITNGLMAWTASLDSTYATDAQLLPILQATRSLELLSGSMIGITNGLMAYTASNETWRNGIRAEINGIEAWTASIDSIYASDVQLLPILQATRSLEILSGSMIGITNGLMAYTASNQTWRSGIRAEIDGIEAWTASLDSIYASDSQLLPLYQATASLNTFSGSLIGITNGLMAFTAALDSTYATDAQLLQLYQATRSLEILSGSLIGITNGLMAFTAGLDSTYATDAQLLPILQTTASLNTFTGSIQSEVSGIEAYTASLKGAAIVSSSQQIIDYNTFAVTSSANTFYGNQTISGSLRVNGPLRGNTISGGLDVNGGITGSVKGNLDGVANYASTVAVSNTGTTTDTTLFPIFSISPVLGSYTNFYSHASSSFFLNGVTRRVHMEGFVVSGSNNIAEISGSLIVTGSSTITGSLNISGSITINSGSITMPNRPAFRVVGTGSTDRVAQTTLSGSYASIDYNEGNYYNNSTGIFTAPLTGLYNVYYNGRCGSVNAMQQVIIYKNGATGNAQLMWEAPGNTGVAHFGVSGVFKLVAGDTLEAKVAVGSIQFDGNDTWGAAYIG
jgi:cytoskeletal protein CcmA (bactofilin family)